MTKLRNLANSIILRWQNLPPTYRNYVSLYALTLPFGLISIFVPALQVVYGLVFFAISVVTVFNPKADFQYPDHSTLDHFERASRFNWWNYLMAGFVAMSAFLFVFLPINAGLIAIICWTFASAVLLIYMPLIELKLAMGMIEDYLKQQFMDISRLAIHQFVQAKVFELKVDLPELTKSQIAELEKMYQKYITNNQLEEN